METAKERRQNMGTQCGWASLDENGNISGGSAGDQTGQEVKLGNWYNFGQNTVLRFNDRSVASRAATVMKNICNNNHVGYDQSQRTTLYTQLKNVGWDVSKLTTNCECDCSSLIAVVLNAVGINVSKDIYTGNMVTAIMNTGKFTKLTDSKYTSSDQWLQVGDIMVNPGSHTIMAIENGINSGGGNMANEGVNIVRKMKPGAAYLYCDAPIYKDDFSTVIINGKKGEQVTILDTGTFGVKVRYNQTIGYMLCKHLMPYIGVGEFVEAVVDFTVTIKKGTVLKSVDTGYLGNSVVTESGSIDIDDRYVQKV